MSVRFGDFQRSSVALFGAFFFTAALIVASAPTILLVLGSSATGTSLV